MPEPSPLVVPAGWVATHGHEEGDPCNTWCYIQPSMLSRFRQRILWKRAVSTAALHLLRWCPNAKTK